MLRRRPRTCDEDVDEAAGAGLPTGLSRGVKDANEGTDEVGGFRVGAEITAGDGALDGDHERGMDERPGAFREAHGTSGESVHGGNDELLSGEVVDEEQHPGAEGFEWRHGSGEARLCGSEFFNFVTVNSFDKGVASSKVAI